MNHNARIEAMYLAPEAGGELYRLPELRVEAGLGIVGDRNFGEPRWPGQNISFIEAEVIEAFNREFGHTIDFGLPRRNIVTRGLRLNALEGREFAVGDLRFRGIELCEPCAMLGARLEMEGLSKKEIVKWFLHRGGLRAEVLSSGLLREGQTFALPEPVLTEPSLLT